MAPSNRIATSGIGVKRRQQPPTSHARAKKRADNYSVSGAAQSSILSFLIPKVKEESNEESALVARSPEIPRVVVLDDEEADDDVEVTGVTPGISAMTEPEKHLASPPPQSSLSPPIAAPSSTAVRQASLLRFFTSNADKDTKRLKDQPQQQQQQSMSTQLSPKPACGTWPSASGRTSCPPVKWIDGTDLTVDAFNYGAQARCRGYFLSHFHSDHYCGLGRKFDGQLLASKPTAELVRLRLGVRPAFLQPLELQKWHDVPGAQVLLLDANHCPGSVVFLFRLRPTGRRILHTGDFRASPDLLSSIRGWLGESPEIDSLYLDTTYCSPQYDFPPQSDIIESVLRLVREFVAEHPRNYLIACGSYTLGKERMYLSIARLLGCRAAVDSAKLRLLNALSDPEISELIVKDDGRSRLQVLPLHTVSHAGLRRLLEAWRRRPDRPRVDACLGISPTGWSLGARGVQIAPGVKRIFPGKADRQRDLELGDCCPTVTVYAAAYSEHSSFGELRDFVRGIRPRRILPTVNWHKRDACRLMQAHFDSWLRN